jgi:hypothetical protein
MRYLQGERAVQLRPQPAPHVALAHGTGVKLDEAAVSKTGVSCGKHSLHGLALRPGDDAPSVGKGDERHWRCPDGELHEVLGLAGAERGRAGVRAGRQCGITW